MKKLLLISALLGMVSLCTQAQIKINVKEKLKNQTQNRADDRTEQGIDKGLDKGENAVGNLFKKKNKKDKSEKDKNKDEKQSNDAAADTKEDSNQSGNDATEVEDTKPKSPELNWASYDFVPGDEVIFEDAPSINEENGEFPSRWDLVQGQVEIAEVDGENVIMFLSGNPTIIPYLKNSGEDYLPDVFTIEFEMYKPFEGNRFQLHLNDKKNQQKNGDQEIEINSKRITTPDGNYSEHPDITYEKVYEARWIKVALAYTKGKLKIYMDGKRLINIPHYDKNPSGVTVQAYFADMSEKKPYYLRNFRIAKGGVKYYDRVMSEGKIICNGIRFDVNKATLKPESMGPINKIYKLMQKNPDIKFSVEGHTDSDGNDDSNMKLSKERAKVVMDKLIAMGISKDRLKYDGFGETKPIAPNNTPEGKANNRRVEFVKF